MWETHSLSDVGVEHFDLCIWMLLTLLCIHKEEAGESNETTKPSMLSLDIACEKLFGTKRSR